MRFFPGRRNGGLVLLLAAGCNDYTCADTASCSAPVPSSATPSSAAGEEAGVATMPAADAASSDPNSQKPTTDGDASVTSPDSSSESPPSATGADSSTWRSQPASGDEDAGIDPSSPEPLLPSVSIGQVAELVLGQSDFDTVTPGKGNSMFSSASALSSDGAHLWVLDLANSRVVQFNAQPIANKQQADLAIGQRSLLEYTDGP